MFTQKHYKFLADWAKNAAMAVSILDRNLMVYSLADRLERHSNEHGNGKFNRIEFLNAAGVKTGDYLS